MATFRGEYIVRVGIGVVIDAENLEAAHEALNHINIAPDNTDDVICLEWDDSPINATLIED